jgi:hypothetical protein
MERFGFMADSRRYVWRSIRSVPPLHAGPGREGWALVHAAPLTMTGGAAEPHRVLLALPALTA